MAYCTGCGKETEWTSKSGYCKECATAVLDGRAIVACAACGRSTAQPVSISHGSKLDCDLCPDCADKLKGAREFIANSNVRYHNQYSELTKLLLSSKMPDNTSKLLRAELCMSDELYERERRNMKHRSADAQGGYWEYMTLCVPDSSSGGSDAANIRNCLNYYGRMGWKLRCAVTNEIGKRETTVGLGRVALGTNATLDTTVLILERFVAGQ